MSSARNLYCPKCEKQYELGIVINLCTCGSPLLVDYDYEIAARTLKVSELHKRVASMWKYRELLPVQDEDNIVSLGEGGTPLLKSRNISKELGLTACVWRFRALRSLV